MLFNTKALIRVANVSRICAFSSARGFLTLSRHRLDWDSPELPRKSEAQLKKEQDELDRALPPELKRKMDRGTYFWSWQSALFTLVLSGSMLAFYLYEFEKKKNKRAAVTEEHKIGTPLLGGPWTLYDSQGQVVSDTDFLGKYVVMYFGFTYCPDICPQELEKMGLVIEKLDKLFGPIVQPIYVTVDPARDTVAQTELYCRVLHTSRISSSHDWFDGNS
eukprot:Platyproteum_vivax@DN6395_c0_g1_i1.p1